MSTWSIFLFVDILRSNGQRIFMYARLLYCNEDAKYDYFGNRRTRGEVLCIVRSRPYLKNWAIQPKSNDL